MNIRGYFLYVLLLLTCATMAKGAAAAEAFGNFHTMGVVLDPPTGVKAADVAEVRLFMETEAGDRRLLDPVPVADFNWFAASVFHLQPGTEYAFRAEYYDANGVRRGEERFQGTTRSTPETPPAETEIHVSPEGDDGASGATDTPKKTLAAALREAAPGVQIVLHEGTYYEGDLAPAKAGQAGAPLVIRGATGEKVIIDGGESPETADKWRKLGNGYYARKMKRQPQLAYLAFLRLTREFPDALPKDPDALPKDPDALPKDPDALPKEIEVRGRRMYRVASKADFEAQHVGSHRFKDFDIYEAFHFADGEIRVFTANRPDDSGDRRRFRVAVRGGAIELSNKPHVIIEGVTFRCFDGQAVYVNDSSDVVIRNCRFEFVNLPIAVKRKSDRLLVEKCVFHDDCARWGFLPKTADGGDYAAWIETGAVYVHAPFEGRGMVIRDNEIEGLFDGANIVPMTGSMNVRTSEIDFYNNRIINVCDDFLEVDGLSRNVRVFDNKMHGCLSGVSIAQAVHGPTCIVRNVISGFGESTASTLPPHYEGYPIKTNGGDKHGTTGWVFLYHNTAVTAAPRTNAFRVQVARWRKLTMANNIWSGTRDGFVFWRDDISPLEIDRDIIHAKAGALLKIKKAEYAEAEAAVKALPPLKGAIFADPDLGKISYFQFMTRPQYTPNADSPAIDAGVVIPGVNDGRFRGGGPDIGAFEVR